jgi:hypothetical protein
MSIVDHNLIPFDCCFCLNASPKIISVCNNHGSNFMLRLTILPRKSVATYPVWYEILAKLGIPTIIK